MKIIRNTLLAVALMFVPAALQGQTAPKSVVTKPLAAHVYDAVALLFTQNASGDMKMTCTVTAFAKTEKGYRFVSAAHCVEGNDSKQQKLEKFYVSADTKGAKNYFAAKLIEAGDKKIGDDFSLFEVETNDTFDIIPLGDESTLQMGDAVVDISGALGLGKQYFSGYVSELRVDRPPVDAGQVLWTDVMLIQIGGAPGSSGSAIVSVDQKAIVGFLVGSAPEDVGKICVPVSKFKNFLALVDAGKYKKTPTVVIAETPEF